MDTRATDFVKRYLIHCHISDLKAVKTIALAGQVVEDKLGTVVYSLSNDIALAISCPSTTTI